MTEDIVFNKKDLLTAIYETDSGINKEIFYIKCVYSRVEKCSETYFSEFDNELKKILTSLENNNFDYKSIKKLAKLSRRVVSDIYDRYIEVLETYLKE